MKILIRVIIFQALWFLFAYWGQLQYQWLVPLIALASVLIDWKYSQSSIKIKNFCIFLAFLTITGICIDSILFSTPWIITEQKGPLSPMNMWGFWIIFAPYYDFAFEKFNRNKLMAIIFALIGAPMAYRGGSQLAGFSIEAYGFILIALLWGLFFPLSLKLYFDKLNKS